MISLIATKDLKEGTSRGIEIDNNFLFAIKKDDLYHVYWNICPHIGTPLEWQEDQFLDDDGELPYDVRLMALYLKLTAESV